MQDIGAIHQFQRFTHIVIGNQNPDTTGFKVGYKLPDITNGNGINAGKGFIQQQIFGVGRQTAGNFHPPPLTARQRQGRCAAQMFQTKIGQEFLKALSPLVPILFRNIQNRGNIIFDAQAAKNRGFLRQIANTQPRPAIHRQAGDILSVQQDLTPIRGNKSCNCIKASCFS